MRTRLGDGAFAEQHGHNLLSTVASCLVQCIVPRIVAVHKVMLVCPPPQQLLWASLVVVSAARVEKCLLQLLSIV